MHDREIRLASGLRGFRHASKGGNFSSQMPNVGCAPPIHDLALSWRRLLISSVSQTPVPFTIHIFEYSVVVYASCARLPPFYQLTSSFSPSFSQHNVSQFSAQFRLSMLDPITITTSIGALLKAAYSIAVELKSFRDSITIVQEKLDGLLQDVEALASVLTSMRDTFEGITAGVGTDNIGKHWQDISRALENGKETLAQLHECLQEVNRTSKIMDAPRKQLRLTFATDRLALFRQHVQSYRDALQLSLQTVILYVRPFIIRNTHVATSLKHTDRNYVAWN